MFKTDGNPLGRTTLAKHERQATDEWPVRQRAHGLPIHQRKENEKQVEAMLQEDITEPLCSPWASPVVLVKKKDEVHPSL